MTPIKKETKKQVTHSRAKPNVVKVRKPSVEVVRRLAEVAPVIVTDDEERQLDQIIAAADQEAGAKEKYYEAIGRRKDAVARVRLLTKKSTDAIAEDQALLTVNGKNYRDYFSDVNLLAKIESPLRKLKSLHRFKATVLVRGGGISGQADAVRHGIARALEKFDGNFRKKLKKAGYLTRDPREKERRKFGHKKARKSGRWSKR